MSMGSVKWMVLALAALVSPSAYAQGQVLWYNGDYDGRPIFDALASGRNLSFGDSRVYDNFDSTGWVIQEFWGNFMITEDALSDSQGLYYELRRGITQGNGGTLVASGTVNIETRIATGRVGIDRQERRFHEWQILGKAPNITLGPGEFWLTLAVIGRGRGLAFLSTTDGRDADPNPPPVGYKEGNSYEDSTTFQLDFEKTEKLTGETTDASLGMSGVVPEPTTIAALSVGVAALMRRRRSNR